jgi:hypothetical protein
MSINHGQDEEEMPKFVPGLELSQRYYKQVVAPILKRRFPELKYSAGLVGSGSEVLGYDTPRSRDHNWGLRLSIFLSKEDMIAKKPLIDKELRKELPLSFLGYPTSFGKPDKIGVRLPNRLKNRTGRIDHFILFLTIDAFLKEHLGNDDYDNLKATAWLTVPQQKLLEVTSGRIYRDDLQISAVIDRFRYYPRDVWLYKMAAQWLKISEVEAFVGRTDEVGDELGSTLISARIVEELVQLSFLMERRYAPYSKWLGTAFSELEISSKLTPILMGILKSGSVAEREQYLSKAYQIVAKKHNSLHITHPIPTGVSTFYKRPYLVIHCERFAIEIGKQIKDEEIPRLT